MKYRTITSGKTTIRVSVSELMEDGLYTHELFVTHKEVPVARFCLYNKKKKLSPDMWFEAYEAAPKDMANYDWEMLIRDLVDQKEDYEL